jgi:hypothetical protein
MMDVLPDSLTRFTTEANQNVSVWAIPIGQLLLRLLKHEDSIAAVKAFPEGSFWQEVKHLSGIIYPIKLPCFSSSSHLEIGLWMITSML